MGSGVGIQLLKIGIFASSLKACKPSMLKRSPQLKAKKIWSFSKSQPEVLDWGKISKKIKNVMFLAEQDLKNKNGKLLVEET